MYIQRADLPAQMRREQRKADEKGKTRARAPSRASDESNRQPIEEGEHRLRALPEQEGGRLDPDQGVVLPVLMRVDGVIPDHPGDGSEVEQERRRIEAREDRRPP